MPNVPNPGLSAYPGAARVDRFLTDAGKLLPAVTFGDAQSFATRSPAWRRPRRGASSQARPTGSSSRYLAV